MGCYRVGRGGVLQGGMGGMFQGGNVARQGDEVAKSFIARQRRAFLASIL